MTLRRIRPRPVGDPGAPIILTVQRLKNAAPREFRATVLNLPMLAYDVEDLADGRKVLVTKPGGKSVHNIMVWIYEGPEGRHWRPSHGLIRRDLELKLHENREQGLRVIDALRRVYQGEDPDDVLEQDPSLGAGLSGLAVDLILKAYKWIWVQEDCNYPPPRYQGRQMSMEAIEELHQSFTQTGQM